MQKLTPIFLMIFLFSLTINSQNNYTNLWEEVQKFEKDNLPKSALEIVNDIYAKAEKAQNSSQIIKCLFYKSKFALTLEENAQLKIIDQFKEHISISKFPTKNILENVLANLYWQYFQQNRWKFYNRTQTQNKVDLNDFRTWDLDTLFAEIHNYYQKSLESGLLLQQTNITTFNNILLSPKNSREYRPTLYDFLAHNALQFYKTSENNITKPAYQFKLDNPDLLSDAKEFSQLMLSTKDSLSLQFNAVKVYQDLIAFHLKDKDKKALVDVDLHRLNFIRQYATVSNKEKLFFQTLKASEKKFKNNEVAGLYAYEIAKTYNQQGNVYQPITKEKNQFKRKEALTICEAVIKQFPNSSGAKKCELLKHQILSKSVQIVAEEYIPSHQFSKVLVTYRNIKKLYFSVYKISFTETDKLHKTRNKQEKINFINKLTKVEYWSNNLKSEGDYQQHSTEISIPKLTQGNYLIVASLNENLNINTAYGTVNTQVSNLVFINNDEGDNNIYQVVNRNTGAPIVGAKVLLSNKESDRYGDKINKTFVTGKYGEFTVNLFKKYYNNVYATVSYKDDKAKFGQFYINQQYRPQKQTPKPKMQTFLFTDRSIYRPGQTVYFKGISMETFNNKSTVKSNETVLIELRDVNGQTVKKLQLKTNEFGSFSGEFVIPNTGLTGHFGIESEIDGHRNYHSVSVEEYKRPKFETEFNPITKSYKVNNEITVNGFAKAFSGTTVTDAKVVYRVHRKVQYPRWWYWHRPQFSSEPQEIIHGDTTTDEKGNFEIKFKAIPDESVSKDNLPVFTYEVTADVTDLNGETRSTTTNIKVGYHALLTTAEIDDHLDKSKKDYAIKISTKNLNDEFVPAEGIIKIYKLVSPKQLLRKRPWNTPDYQEIPQVDFEKKFPHDSYTNEDNFRNWKKGKLVFESKFNTAKEKEVQLKNIKKWTSGKYIIELDSQDKFDQKVTDKQFFSVFSEDDKLPTDNQLISITTNKEAYKIGDKAEITVGTNSPDVTVILSVEKQHKTVDKHYIHLNKSSKTIKVPVTKKDEGGFAIKYYFVNFNSFVSGSKIISVPYPKTDLEISTKTFRDKLLPGENQTWSFTIKGSQKDKVLAEVLAGMYDASLDKFKPHNWSFQPIYHPIYSSYRSANAQQSFKNTYATIRNLNQFDMNSYQPQSYDQFNWFGFRFGNNRRVMMMRGAVENEVLEEAVNVEYATDESEEFESGMANSKTLEVQNKENLSKGIQIRKNLQETAFFYPNLTTDKNGNVEFNFTVPEALTRWKLQLLAHTKELHSATKTLTTVTQKELMVVPNAPRFLREGDTITLSSKISNLSDTKLQGSAQLILTDAITGKKIDLFTNSKPKQSFTVDTKGNTNVSWNLSILDNLQAIKYKVIAKAGNFSDGEQNVLPVLSNRMLVTETLPMWVRTDQTKTFSLDKLKNQTSTTLSHHKLTLEITSNPAWYAVQALPYLMEYPYECSEQTFARYYANTLASHIANSNPRIQEVFNQWKSSDALLSNLEKNQELKSLIIQETPWVRDAQSETEQKKRIALLFDLNKMKNEQQNAIHKLKNMQMNNGGFPWFKGGRYPNHFITNYIASGFGHLKQLGISDFNKDVNKMLVDAIHFLDIEIADQYKKLLKQAARIKEDKGQKKYEEYLAKNHLNYFALQYLYMRSFYRDVSLNSKTQKAVDYYKNQSAKYWAKQNLYGQGLIALVQYRNGGKIIANKILKSLKENSITSDELGMYWKANQPSWYWYQAPIETQALLIEAFSEIENNTKTIDNLKIWLLKNKQVSRWKTTKATTEAVYALLLKGSNWLSVTETVDVTLGDLKIEPNKMPDVKVEAGTGYFKTSWNTTEITPKMSEVTISKKGKGIAWGGLYWQYFENLDKITSVETPLKLRKKLFKKINTDTGKKLIEITNKTSLKIGDLITVRIELRSDRDMEFIHMKDMRASGVEPINVLSQYKWQDDLGYYESTKDAATNFFFDRLPKGVYVFEYDIRVNNAGNFSNGITTIQSMYAPEFSSHSKGTRIIIN